MTSPGGLIPIFATPGDLAGVMEEVARERLLCCALGGLFANLGEVRELAFPRYEAFQSLIIFEQGAPLVHRVVPQRDGSRRYAVDQSAMPDSVELACGGLMEGERLVAGRLATCSQSVKSREIFALLSDAVGRRFSRVRSCRVGPQALALLDSGFRLAATRKSPPLYDLKR